MLWSPDILPNLLTRTEELHHRAALLRGSLPVHKQGHIEALDRPLRALLSWQVISDNSIWFNSFVAEGRGLICFTLPRLIIYPYLTTESKGMRRYDDIEWNASIFGVFEGPRRETSNLSLRFEASGFCDFESIRWLCLIYENKQIVV